MDEEDVSLCVLGTFYEQYVVRPHEMHSSIFHSLWCREVFWVLNRSLQLHYNQT